VPAIVDVDIMSDVLSALGAGVARRPDGALVIEVPPTNGLVPIAPYDLVEEDAASVVVLGPLLAALRVRTGLDARGDDFVVAPSTSM